MIKMHPWLLATSLIVCLFAPTCLSVQNKNCFDFESCRNTSTIDETINCYGELSCAECNSFLSNSQTLDGNCWGDYACSNGFIDNAYTISGYGALSLYNTIINNSDNTMYAYIYGYYAGYNASINCHNDSTCYIFCNGNSCVNLDLTCDDSSTCAIYGTQSYVTTDTFETNGTPLYYYYRGDLAIIPSISESNVITNAYNGGEYCNEYETGSCDYTTIMIDQSYYNVYCRGYRACTETDVTLNNNVDNSGIYCSAKESCKSTLMTNDNNNSKKNNTVYCGSEKACYGAQMIGFNKIYGMGHHALDDTIIMSNGNGNGNEMNVYFASYQAASGLGSKIYCNISDTCNIYCDAFYSCETVTAHCYGECNIYCDIDINSICLTVYNYNITVTHVPSQVPSYAPTAKPINNSDSIPTIQTTRTKITPMTSHNISVANTTTTTTTRTKTTEMVEGAIKKTNDESVNSQSWQIAGYACLILSNVLPVIIVIRAYYFHQTARIVYCDRPNYFAIFVCFWNFGDFYSDLIFTFVLLTTNNYLWYFSLFFVLIPYFASNFISLYNIKKWQANKIYVSKYIEKYDWLIIVSSVLAGFYAGIELAGSKILYMDVFSLQLKNADREKLQNARFFNTVLLENVPQFIIQIVYTYETGSFDIFVITAMIFSVLSVLISLFKQITRKKNSDGQYASEQLYQISSKKTFQMRIECDKLSTYHKYCHKILTRSLWSVIGNDNFGNIEVFYIINVRNGIIAYLEASNVTLALELEMEMEMVPSNDADGNNETTININNNNNNNNNDNNNTVTVDLFSQLLSLTSDIEKDKALKQEITERLFFGSKSVAHSMDNIEQFEKIISNMKIRIKPENRRLSVQDKQKSNFSSTTSIQSHVTSNSLSTLSSQTSISNNIVAVEEGNDGNDGNDTNMTEHDSNVH